MVLRRPLSALLVWAASVGGIATAAVPARADGPDCSDNVVSVQVENDVFTPLSNTDSHYTNGLRASFVTPLADDCIGLGKRVRGLAHWLAPADTIRTEERVGYSIGQSLFTPEDTDTRELVPDDRPYAAWLYLGLGYQATYERLDGSAVQDTAQLDLGVVGPAALGEEVQNTYHRLIGVDEVNGWDNQLHNEPGLNLSFERKWRSAQSQAFAGTGLYFDALPFVHGTVGNILTYAGGGATLRLGQGLGSDFGPPRIRPGLPGSEAFTPDHGFAWYVFAGAEGQLVLRNIFLDGNSFRDSHSVDREPLVADLQAGFALIYESWRVTYTHVLRSPEFDEQNELDQFGAITLSVRF
ncbi:MAG: membrane protein [Alphaproteobacteria bacterium]|nr:MAG: membrane protein [Alphaproteobacteria bacterium]